MGSVDFWKLVECVALWLHSPRNSKDSFDILKIWKPKKSVTIQCKYVVFWCVGNDLLAFAVLFWKTKHVGKPLFFLAQETNHEDLRGPNWTQQKQRAYPTTDCFASNGKSHALAWHFVAASWLDGQWKCLAVEVASYWKGWWFLAPFWATARRAGFRFEYFLSNKYTIWDVQQKLKQKGLKQINTNHIKTNITSSPKFHLKKVCISLHLFPIPHLIKTCSFFSPSGTYPLHKLCTWHQKNAQ